MQRSDLVSLVLVSSGLNRLYHRRLAGPGFPILAYHEVRGKTLEAHLKALSPYYRFMSLEDALAYQVPDDSRPPLVLTFDDGYQSWLTETVPVLKKRRIPALFFPCTSFLDRSVLPWYEVLDRYIRRRRGKFISVGTERFGVRELARAPDRRREFNQLLKSMSHAELLRVTERLEASLTDEDKTIIRNRYLTWDGLRQISGFDLEIGAHTVSHPILSRIPVMQAREEIVQSKARLEAELGRKVRYFAYPNGLAEDFNEAVVGEVQRAGFEGGLTALPGWNPPGSDPLRLHRAVVAPQGSVWRLRATASGLLGLLEEAARMKPSASGLRGLVKEAWRIKVG